MTATAAAASLVDTIDTITRLEHRTPGITRAMTHPYRARILTLMATDPDLEVASPNDLAQHVPATLGTVAYHVRNLLSLGLLVPAGTRQRRGATEHYYRLNIPQED